MRHSQPLRVGRRRFCVTWPSVLLVSISRRLRLLSWRGRRGLGRSPFSAGGRAARPLAGIVDFPGSTVESRRAAIANSDKPNFKIVDCTPASQEHTLVTSVDMFVDMEPAVKKEVTRRAAAATDPLTPEQIAELAAKEAAKIANAQAIEEMRRQTSGRASGRVEGREIDVTWQGRRPVGTYSNPLRGRYAGMKMSELPQSYLRWGMENVGTPWIRGLYRAELERRYEKAKRPVAG